MKFNRLNPNWNAHPSQSNETLEVEGGNLTVNFTLDDTKHDHIDNGETGTLLFEYVSWYKISDCSAEEYNKHEFRFDPKHLPWSEFYSIGSKEWKKDQPKDINIVNENIPEDRLTGFVLFFGDKILECAAVEAKFSFEHKTIAILEKKYPKGYFNHYLAMFGATVGEPSLENFMLYNNLYLQMESPDEFKLLKQEVKNIKKNQDMDAYLKVANSIGLDFSRQELGDMFGVIEGFKM